jgi:UDP-sulfoquinovose synthase
VKILILGGDGYLGWPTSMRFASLGHDVFLVDSLIKRFWEAEVGASPLEAIPSLKARCQLWNETQKNKISHFIGDISKSPRFIYKIVEDVKPDVVIHYAEQPSAPYSMINRETCLSTHSNNVDGTLNLVFALKKYVPDCHIIKLGTMGEYGTPNIDIEEGWIEIEHNGRKDRMLFPKKPGSFYHLTKVHDSNNLEFVARVWGMRVTDLNQGVVYGIETNETALNENFKTSFHYDSIFGTVLNRFLIQSVKNVPLTVYGNGSQTRGFLNIRDTLKCVQIAAENPADQGEFRVFNQFTEQFSVIQLAEKISSVAKTMGFRGEINNCNNPRVEQENHYYNAKNTGLIKLGLSPQLLDDEWIARTLDHINKIPLQNVSFDENSPMWRQN